MPRRKPTPEEDVLRFWSKINIKGPEECWEWKESKHKFGYGQFWLNSLGRVCGAHVFAYETTYGKLQKGLCVRHTCDNPPCCNPNHLLAGTIYDNNQDRKIRGRGKSGLKDHPEKSSKWENHRLSKFTNEEVETIRKLVSAGEETYSSLAKKFNVTYQCIWLIVKERNWKKYEISE